jgi:hypothetical protein
MSGRARPPEANELYAWGQYLEMRGPTSEQSLGNQYGIYGTAAGIQILALHSLTRYKTVVSRSARILPLVLRNLDEACMPIQRKFIAKGDLDVVYKLCALLDVATTLEATSREFDVDRSAAIARLLEIRIPQSGWPDYKSDDDYLGPNPHATAVALFAISKADLDQDSIDACREALCWLSDEAAIRKQSVATLSMIIMAIANLNEDRQVASQLSLPQVLSLQGKCETAIKEWIQSSSPSEVQRSLEGTEYWLPPGAPTPNAAAGARFTFLLYIPHCLATLAAISSPRLRKSYSIRQYIFGIISFVTEELANQGCFIAAGRSMVSTVEHLWLYRMLHEFEKQTFYASRLRSFVDTVRNQTRQRWPITTAGAIATICLVVAASITDGRLQLALTGISGMVVSIATAIIVAVATGR